jgi:hypothetical protein
LQSRPSVHSSELRQSICPLRCLDHRSVEAGKLFLPHGQLILVKGHSSSTVPVTSRIPTGRTASQPLEQSKRQTDQQCHGVDINHFTSPHYLDCRICHQRQESFRLRRSTDLQTV